MANGSAAAPSQLTAGGTIESIWAAFQGQAGVFMRFTVTGGP